VKIQMSAGFKKRLQRRIDKYEFEVGVLEDKAHRKPRESSLASLDTSNLAQYAGGPVRKTSREVGPLTVGEILVENMQRKSVDFLREPFQNQSSDIMKFTKAFLGMAFGRVGKRRVENLLQAVVRNPILRQEYGSNSFRTADSKGFDRFLFDTGQMFKNIKARVLGGA